VEIRGISRVILALTLIIIIGGIWAVATISWLGWRLYVRSLENKRQQAVLAAYKEGLQRPAIALLTQEQINFIAAAVSPKKDYIN
jgi:hypothetical protein